MSDVLPNISNRLGHTSVATTEISTHNAIHNRIRSGMTAAEQHMRLIFAAVYFGFTKKDFIKGIIVVVDNDTHGNYRQDGNSVLVRKDARILRCFYLMYCVFGVVLSKAETVQSNGKCYYKLSHSWTSAVIHF